MPAVPTPEEQRRCEQLGMTWPDLYAYRRKLRADYRRSLASPGREVASALSTGALWFLTDPDAELAVTMANRALTPAEWEQYTRSPQALRKRRPMTRTEALAAEMREDARTFGGAR